MKFSRLMFSERKSIEGISNNEGKTKVNRKGVLSERAGTKATDGSESHPYLIVAQNGGRVSPRAEKYENSAGLATGAPGWHIISHSRPGLDETGVEEI